MSRNTDAASSAAVVVPDSTPVDAVPSCAGCIAADAPLAGSGASAVTIHFGITSSADAA
ncbi:hypothetical protein [Paraburkholderia caribensis]|uniref:hypothetical protein n=1 Tax=Paraburkholderia caribensis TaxID=75105 RepID=UPI00131496CF|nr:hypothetical protein [Paraburkholderia caribensis]MCO4882772.1 hypothetical protein [Paraburkholderia caribensis]MDR6384161.1 hypothetical protein [Paraburkholderia caribensis]